VTITSTPTVYVVDAPAKTVLANTAGSASSQPPPLWALLLGAGVVVGALLLCGCYIVIRRRRERGGRKARRAPTGLRKVLGHRAFRLVLGKRKPRGATFKTLKAWSSTSGMDLVGVAPAQHRQGREAAVSESSDGHADEYSPTLGGAANSRGPWLTGWGSPGRAVNEASQGFRL
jgi:hypothetical protein